MELKNFRIIGFIFLFLIMSIGCEKLEIGNKFIGQPPELDYSMDSIWVSADRAREVLWNAYTTLPWGLPTFGGGGSPWPGNQGGLGPMPVWQVTDYFSTVVHFTYYLHGWVSGSFSAQDINGKELSTKAYGEDKYGWLRDLAFDGARKCYIFLDNIDKVPDMDASEKKLLKAEAKMIIATNFVHMFRFYGGILWPTHAYEPTEDFHLERLTVLQTVDTLTALIDEAIPDLPFELDDPETWSGRFTSAAAMAVKVKLLETAAAPLFNSDEPYMDESYEAVSKHLVWTGGYNRKLWEDLRDACKELIDKIEASSYYKMVNTGHPRLDYRSAYYDRWSGETLLSSRRNFKTTNGLRNGSLSWLRFKNNWGMTIPNQNLAEIFPMRNGLSIHDPASGYDPQNPFFDRDPRFSEVILYNGNPDYRGRKAELWYDGEFKGREGWHQKGQFTGYGNYKWQLDWASMSGKIIHWPFIRIPEIYLAYAEALNELNDGPTAEALTYANKTRERVGVGPIEDYIGKPLGSITKQEFLDALLNERSCELVCEDVRWHDMSRYKLVDAYKKPYTMLTVKLTQAARDMGSDFRDFFQANVGLDEHDQYFVYDFTTQTDHIEWYKDHWDNKWFLSPFPSVEVQKGYGLVQNPGW